MHGLLVIVEALMKQAVQDTAAHRAQAVHTTAARQTERPGGPNLEAYLDAHPSWRTCTTKVRACPERCGSSAGAGAVTLEPRLPITAQQRHRRGPCDKAGRCRHRGLHPWLRHP